MFAQAMCKNRFESNPLLKGVGTSWWHMPTAVPSDSMAANLHLASSTNHLTTQFGAISLLPNGPTIFATGWVLLFGIFDNASEMSRRRNDWSMLRPSFSGAEFRLKGIKTSVSLSPMAHFHSSHSPPSTT
ncbi:unnamed protein product [Ectocarpus sp. 12 AP-2014]